MVNTTYMLHGNVTVKPTNITAVFIILNSKIKNKKNKAGSPGKILKRVVNC